jgi:hypothetical protein
MTNKLTRKQRRIARITFVIMVVDLTASDTPEQMRNDAIMSCYKSFFGPDGEVSQDVIAALGVIYDNVAPHPKRAIAIMIAKDVAILAGCVATMAFGIWGVAQLLNSDTSTPVEV